MTATRKRISGLQALLGAFALLAATSSHAVPITVAGSSANVFVDSANAASGSFDINSAVSTLGFSSSFSITSGTLTFLFADNRDATTSVTQYSTSDFIRLPDTCGSTISSCQANYKFVDRYGRWIVDPAETARVTVDSQSATAASNSTSYTLTGNEYARGSTSCGFLGCGFVPEKRSHCSSFLGATICDGPWPVYDQTTEFYTLANGAFSINLTLDANSILDLSNDGVLDFSINSLLGDFNFLSASLTADVVAGAGPVDPGVGGPTNPAGVPEPATALLFGLGALMIRRRKRA